MSSASAAFEIQINSGSWIAAGDKASASGGDTINLRLVSTEGVTSVAWSFHGSHAPLSGYTPPTITPSGTPVGATATFTLPAGNGQALGVQADVNGGEDVTGNAAHTFRSSVRVALGNGEEPFFLGETLEDQESAGEHTHGPVPKLNRMLAGLGGGGSGEANTTSNEGGGDAELALTKSGVNLPFRTISGTNGIAVTENSNVVEISGAGLGGSGQNRLLRYDFSTTTTDADPGANTLRLNNAAAGSATFIYIDDLDKSGQDKGALFSPLDTGDLVYIEDTDEPTKNVLYTLTGAPTDGTGYWKIPVGSPTAGSAFTNGQEVSVSIIKVVAGSVGTLAQVLAAGNTTGVDDETTGNPIIISDGDHVRFSSDAASLTSGDYRVGLTHSWVGVGSNEGAVEMTIGRWGDSGANFYEIGNVLNAAVGPNVRLKGSGASPSVFEVNGNGIDAALATGDVFALSGDNLTPDNYLYLNASGNIVTNTGPAQAAGGLRVTFSTTTIDADPGNGIVRLNNATQGSATYVYIDDQDPNGLSIVNIVQNLRPGDILVLQQRGDATRFWAGTVSGAVEDASGYSKIPVSNLDFGSALEDTEECVLLVFPSQIPGSEFQSVVTASATPSNTSFQTIGTALTVPSTAPSGTYKLEWSGWVDAASGGGFQFQVEETGGSTVLFGPIGRTNSDSAGKPVGGIRLITNPASDVYEMQIRDTATPGNCTIKQATMMLTRVG